jgi:hypothetical protein
MIRTIGTSFDLVQLLFVLTFLAYPTAIQTGVVVQMPSIPDLQIFVKNGF